MKKLSPAFQAHLDSGATTLAWCWTLKPKDRARVGFTDHDRDIDLDGVMCESSTGFTASEVKDTLGLAIDNLDVSAALSSARLDESDLAGGVYDDAAVEIWRVNWAEPTQRVLMRKGSLGEVRRAGASFSAEVRGLAHYLNQPQGRLYQYGCDATLGDGRCGVALVATPAVVIAVPSTRSLMVSGLSAFAADWFSRGLVSFASGVNIGHRIEVRRHAILAPHAQLELWQPLPRMPSVGDAITVTAGCDKQFATCRDKFANTVNFRGFPHIPGDKLLTSSARPGEGHNGLALR